jgi:hypothetical protein
MPADLKTEIADFSAVLADEDAKQSSGLSAALTAIQTLIKAPVTFKINATQHVTLSQIDATGQRLRVPATESYILLPKTSAEAKRDIGQHSKVFVVYEVYKGANLQIAAESGGALDVGLAIGQSTQSGQGNATKQSDTKAPSATGAATGEAPIGTPKVVSGPVPGCQAKAAPTNAPAPTPSSAVSMSAYWMRSSSSSLSLCGQTQYPFAVRVGEVVLDQATHELTLKPGSFKFPGALAAPSDVEKYTASMNATGVLRNLQRRPPR